MPLFKLCIAYDGTDYQGWQEQTHGKTISNTIKTAFLQTFHQPCFLIGASRTDAGVHACGQVASLQTECVLKADILRDALHDRLPRDIHIVSAQSISNEFHPRYNIDYKIYTYTLFLKRPFPCDSRRGWYFPYALCLNKLEQCMNVFVGTHDFRYFCSSDYCGNTVRSIEAISLDIVPTRAACVITIRGASFLYNMIRRMVGAALRVSAYVNLHEQDIKSALLGNPLPKLLFTAPASGLSLQEIQYRKEFL